MRGGMERRATPLTRKMRRGRIQTNQTINERINAMKKLFSILLVVVILFAMGTTALAAGVGSITINNAVVDETYTIYRLLDLESYNSGTGAYSYKANSAWEAWLRTQTDYVAFDTQGYVTWKTDADAAAFAKLAKAYAANPDNGITAVTSETAAGTTVVFDDLDLGYYLVDTTLGALCSLDTTNPVAEITEKNEAPTIDKQVQEDSDGAFGDTSDADITQTVNFMTTVTAYEGAEAYVVHDEMSAGLTLNQGSIAITVNNADLAAENYTVSFNPTCAQGACDFHIVFAPAFLDTLKDGDQIVITYSATLNENAVVGLPGNPNETWLDYGDNSSTESDQTITYTWDLGVLKTGDKAPVLEGAKFVLLNIGKTQVATFDANKKFAGWADLPAAGAAWPAGAELTTGADGTIHVDGLDADKYYLRETQAPAGYNKLAADVEVIITGATSGDGGTLSYETVVKEIANQSGTILPATGATGTMMFITFGSLGILIAVVFMVTRKKMSIYKS